MARFWKEILSKTNSLNKFKTNKIINERLLSLILPKKKYYYILLKKFLSCLKIKLFLYFLKTKIVFIING